MRAAVTAATGSMCAALCLVLALPAAHAAQDVEYPSYAVVYPTAEVYYPVSTMDRAVTTASIPELTLTTLSGDVNFEVDSANLTSRATEILDGLVGDWKTVAPSSVHIVGHTDDVDTDAYNQDLSERRAKAVGDYLSAKLSGVTITTEGRGESQPISDNDSDEGRAANRRVEITATQ